MQKLSRVNLFTSFEFYLRILIGFIINKKKSFINSIKKKFKTNNFLLFSQGRVALHSCLKNELLFSNKDEIIISPYTLPEVINVIVNLKIKPIFVDLDVKTGLPKIYDVKKKINKNTIGILITHLYSSEKNIKKIVNFAKKNSLCLIEDCAINFGCKIKYNKKTRYLGTLGDYGFFSFGMMKNICLLNGGALYVKDKNKYQQIKADIQKKKLFPLFRFLNLFIFSLLINILFSKIIYNFFTFRILKYSYYKNNYLIKKIYPGLYPHLSKYTPKSFDYDFCTLLSSPGLYHMENFQRKHKDRIKKLKIYENNLKNIKNVQLFEFDTYQENSFLEYPLILKKYKNDYVHNILLKKGFDVRKKWYMNCNKLNKFKIKSFKSKDIDLIDDYILCLPLHDKIDSEYIKEICSLLSNILNKKN